jgi:hypothetical protein
MNFHPPLHESPPVNFGESSWGHREFPIGQKYFHSILLAQAETDSGVWKLLQRWQPTISVTRDFRKSLFQLFKVKWINPTFCTSFFYFLREGPYALLKLQLVLPKSTKFLTAETLCTEGKIAVISFQMYFCLFKGFKMMNGLHLIDGPWKIICSA